MGQKFGRLCTLSYIPRMPSPMPTKMMSSKGSKHYRSDVQSCNELSMSIPRYFSYPTKNDHVRRFDQLSWKTNINMLGDHDGVLLVIWRGKGKGKLAAKMAVG